eukprot:3511862-Amphidinium_carterae.1
MAGLSNSRSASQIHVCIPGTCRQESVVMNRTWSHTKRSQYVSVRSVCCSLVVIDALLEQAARCVGSLHNRSCTPRSRS